MTLPPTPCPYCAASAARASVYSTFKHRWYFCLDCESIRRKAKDRYPLDWLIDALSKGRFARKVRDKFLPPYLGRANVESRNYGDYGAYFDWLMSGDESDGFYEVKRKKYFKEPQEVIDVFEKSNVKLDNLSILDVSGGPGIFAYLVHPFVRKITISEYDPRTVQALADRLPGVRVISADLNDRWVDEEIFDVVLYRSCLVFCEDIAAHVRDMYDRISPGGYIYIYTASPTLGNTLRWQYEDYTFNVAYSDRYVRSVLQSAGYTIIAQGKSEEYRHYLRWFTLREALPLLWGIWNFFLPRRPRGLDARAFWVIARKGSEPQQLSAGA